MVGLCRGDIVELHMSLDKNDAKFPQKTNNYICFGDEVMEVMSLLYRPTI
jgi:hypothetical protein